MLQQPWLQIKVVQTHLGGGRHNSGLVSILGSGVVRLKAPENIGFHGANHRKAVSMTRFSWIRVLVRLAKLRVYCKMLAVQKS